MNYGVTKTSPSDSPSTGHQPVAHRPPPSPMSSPGTSESSGSRRASNTTSGSLSPRYGGEAGDGKAASDGDKMTPRASDEGKQSVEIFYFILMFSFY